MLNKPTSCQGCPLYGDGMGYVPDELVPGAKVMVVLQNPGADEELAGQPAVGATGTRMDTVFLPFAELSRGVNVSVGNILKCRHSIGRSRTNKLPPKKQLDAATEHCVSKHLRIPDAVTHIVAQGSLSARVLGGLRDEIHSWRGCVAPQQFQNRPVYITLHLADLFREPRMTIPSYSDWQKIPHWVSGHWPEPIPERTITGLNNIYDKVLSDILECPFIVMDGEWRPSHTMPYITLIGAVGRHPTKGLIGIQFTQPMFRDKQLVMMLLKYAKKLVFHNAMADMEVFERALGLTLKPYTNIEDTMLQHAVLYSEWPHDLEFLESFYSKHAKMKHLSKEDPLLYNWGDCLTTLSSYEVLTQDLEKDEKSKYVYETLMLPLFDVRLNTKHRGIPLDTQFLADMWPIYQQRVGEARLIAQSFVGYPFNVASQDQLIAYFSVVEPTALKLKKGKKTQSYSFDRDNVTEYRKRFIEINAEDELNGITSNQAMENIARGGHPLLEARALYQSASKLISAYFIPLLINNTNPPASEDFTPIVHPNQAIHAQSTGRWTTTDPALPTLPKALRPMVTTWKDWVIIKFDWDQIELRISACLAGDTPTLKILQDGGDIHTVNCCDCFELPYPPVIIDPHHAVEAKDWRARLDWQGKDDRRRVFAKRFVYRIIYRGNSALAGDVPGAKALGLTSANLVKASKAYLRKHPAIPAYWAQLDQTIRATRTVRTFMGRRRILNGSITNERYGSVAEAFREGANHPMQGSVSDVFNTVVRDIYAHSTSERPLWLLYGAHDSQIWTTPKEHESWAIDVIKANAERTWDVHGKALYLPVTLDPTQASMSNMVVPAYHD